MSRILIKPVVLRLLEKHEFINIGTCDFNGTPNVAPKFFIKSKGNFIYLFDYVSGKTFRNLKINPKLSLSITDRDTLVGYQLNGLAKILASGKEFDRVLAETYKKQVDFSVKRLVDGVRHEKKHKAFEIVFPENGAIFKIRVEEIVQIEVSGKIIRDRLKKG